MNNNQELQQLISDINQGKKQLKELTEHNISYFQDQITNSREHLKRDWGLLKKENNFTMSEIREIVYNIEKQAQYLGVCQAKLEFCQEKIK